MAQCSNVGPPLRRFGQIFKPELDNQQELKQEFFNFCLADVFSRDSFRLGCLKGFKHFSLYLRGREELLVTVRRHAVVSEPESSDPLSYLTPTKMKEPSPITNDPRGMAPASPAANETEIASEDENIFLIGGYARYRCPYVWLRAGYVESQEGVITSRDLPLKLHSSDRWSTTNYVRPWEIVAEIVALTVRPVPRNPFALDFEFIESLPPSEYMLLTGALCNFLREVYLKDTPFVDLVYRDLAKLMNAHFTSLPGILLSLQSDQQQIQQQQQQ